MLPIGAINSLSASPITQRIESPLPKIGPATPGVSQTSPTESFGQMLDNMVSSVESKQGQAQDMTKKVLLGETDQLHQSVIAMQEASVAFSMMIEVRNKLVDSYQELMRMQV